MKYFRTLLISFLFIFNTLVYAADYTLKDVIESNESIYNYKPSLLIAPITGSFIKIKDDWYQIRLLVFETKPIDLLHNLNFGKVLEKYKQLDTTPKAAPEALYSTDYFSATLEMKEKGINYLISLRKITDQKLLLKLQNANLN